MKSPRVAYLGPEGTYTEIALKRFVAESQAVSCTTIRGVFESVFDGSVDAGLVPIENVLYGQVAESMDLLLEFREKIYIESSYVLPINHALGGFGKEIKLSSITDVFAHEQALQQCSSFLADSLPKATLHRMPSNAAGVQHILDQKLETAAAIAHAQTIENYGAHVITTDIATSKTNKTRFVLIKRGNARELDAPETTDPGTVTSLLVTPGRDRQGILFDNQCSAPRESRNHSLSSRHQRWAGISPRLGRSDKVPEHCRGNQRPR